jgi:phosphoglycolate phosphatase
MMNLRVVIFDLDGTLLDTLGDIADCANYALSSLGLREHPADAYKRFVGSGVERLMERVVPRESLTPEAASRFIEIYIGRYAALTRGRTEPYEGIPEMIAGLRGIPLKLAVVSNKPHDQVMDAVSRHFGDGVFDAVTGDRPGVPLKPDPAMVLSTLRSLSVEPGEAMYAGDTRIDMMTAKNSRCISVGVTWGFRPDEVRDEGADYVIDSPGELLDIVKSLIPI